MRRIVSLFLVLVIGVGLMSQGSVQAAGDSLPRIYGGDRYETAVRVSTVGWDEATTVILTRGDDFADALAGTPLAHAKGAPILLTKPKQLPQATREEIERLGAREIIILGGPGAVAEEIGTQLEEMGLQVVRIYGATRYETAAAVANDDALGMATTAVLVSGASFPDSLAAASYAARNGFPIVLAEKNSLPVSSREAIGSKDVLVVGGLAVVGAGAVVGLEGNVERIAGATRAATAVELARYFQPGSGAMYIATGQDFADALAGSVLAAKADSGLLLVSPAVAGAVRDYLHEFEPELTILGGENAVSKEVAQRLMNILSYLGENIEFLKASTLSVSPGGSAIRYPHRGYVTTVIDVLGEYLKIQYGSKAGWIPKKDVIPTAKSKDYIRLTWNYTSGHDFVPEPPNVSGYNVYAPVSHTINNFADGTYTISVHVGRNDTIGTARKNGYLTWMTVQQFGRGSNLSNALATDIIAEARRLDVDGINIDFENMGLENRDKFTAFMTGLANKAKAQDFVLSVDVTRYAAGSSWSLCYDRTALGRICDYVILMAYDQTPAGSSTPGPVAGHPWTRSAVDSLLTEVAPQKALLGIPFYNRFWVTDRTVTERDCVRPTGSAVAIRTEPTTVGGEGTVIKRVNSSAVLIYLATVKGENILGNSNWYKVDMGTEGSGYISAYYSEIIPAGTVIDENTRSGHYSYRIIKEMVDNFNPETKTSYWTSLEGNVNTMVQVSITYHAGSQQDLLQYTNSEGSNCKIWLEDVASLKKRLDLMTEKGLGGLAAWSINWMDGEKRLWNYMLAD